MQSRMAKAVQEEARALQVAMRAVLTAAVDRSDRSRDRSIESIDSIDSIIFRSFEIFGNCSWRRCDSNGPKNVKIRAILAIFWSFEDFCRKIRRPYRRRRKQGGGSGGWREVRRRFDRFDNSFGSIDNCPAYLGGPMVTPKRQLTYRTCKPPDVTPNID